ncbi:hypothetical protein [Sulfitobacter mediterraneus]|nr:hypothetical protein [Sulfitobacter mediterraneus]
MLCGRQFSNMPIVAATSVLLAALPLAAQQTAPAAPLSVIDWLGTQAAATPRSQPRSLIIDEVPVAKTGSVPEVSVVPLGDGAPREIGLVPSGITGLPPGLWAGSDVNRLKTLIEALPDLRLPAAQSLLFTVLLAEAQAPKGGSAAGDALALLRVEKLLKEGALDPALSLIEQANVTTSSAHFDLWMQISLLTGTEDRACNMLSRSAHLTADYGIRIFCAARDQKWDNASLTFGSAQALGLMSPEKLDLADRFLHPDAFEEAAALSAPRKMDPLSFRLFEAIGEPQPTRNLPRAFAVADLRDLAGWKAQLEAAERLTRAGALPDNRLLGLYTDRSPAASGGIWDRVAALQRFETALSTGSAEAVAKTLPAVWSAMGSAGLEVTFSSLFYEKLATFDLHGSAGEIAKKVMLLSPNYESAAAPDGGFADLIAKGEVPDRRPDAPLSGAIYDAFSEAGPRADLIANVAQNRLGESILVLLGLLQQGANGDAAALRDALATLRALGLEDTARRAALQVLVLEA